ncbi:MAG: hypothetical protein IPJ65_21345 [Archangiaceae bacterium]|nr:hypothetical protein [Archangiaceae bacterium]
MRRLLLAVMLSGCAAAPEEPPVPVRFDRSLFFGDDALLDDPAVVSFSRLMAAASDDGHGGRLLQQWFHAFGPARPRPAQFVDRFAGGPDASQWDLSRALFKITGVHNRIDLMRDGHCGELRVSAACTHLELQPFHVLFVFRQPAGDGDLDASGQLTCRATARRWAELSRLEGEVLRARVGEAVREGLTHARFVQLETVELTSTPWEWRQWVKGASPDTVTPAPLFQQLDVEGLNAPGPRRDALLGWVKANAAALQARTLLFPEGLRASTAHAPQNAPRVPLSLEGAGVPEGVRQNVELVGCVGCHTADASFLQTRSDRSVSPFYEKELHAREAHLMDIVLGQSSGAPFGPLQRDPVMPQ